MATAEVDAKSERPNVTLVMTDDQGYPYMSCHGNPVLKTPNMDMLSAASVRFSDFHVNPFCAPTQRELVLLFPNPRNGLIQARHFVDSKVEMQKEKG